MIDREGIILSAKAAGLDPFWVENDYLQHIVLAAMFGSLPTELVLKGGTALQKVYGLPRLSRDLDFNLSGTATSQKELESAFGKVNDYYATRFEKPKKVKHGLGYVLRIEGPSFGSLNQPHRLPLTINTEERLSLKPFFKTINPSAMYKDPDLRTYSLLAMDRSEIFSEKIRAVVTRKEPEPRDLYDMKFLLDEGVRPDMDLTKAKLAFDHSEFKLSTFKSRIRLMRKGWEDDLSSLIRDLPPYDEVADAVIKNIEGMDN
jgi:predicted nucleotidyltransferase component of viral defense system